MSFPTLTVTGAGKGMMIAALNGETVNFSRVKIGSGNAPSNIEEMTDIVNPLESANLTGFTVGANSITVEFVFTNEDVETRFSWKEVGLFATCDGTESLFAYANAGSDAETVPANTESFYEENTYSLTVIVDNTENLSATVKSLTYASKDDFDDHIRAIGVNVHGETAESIGLGNVPNVATNDQTPTWNEAGVLVNINSGEKITVIMGKIAKGLRDLITHITTFGQNIHQETPESLGCASKTHTHNVSDFNDGTLSIARGGTGRTTWTSGNLIFASSASALGQIGKPNVTSVMMQDSTGNPYWYALRDFPIFHAGTSAPENTNLLWIDTTPVTGGLKYYNGSSWARVPVDYTS